MITSTATVKLDRDRPISFTNRAVYRLGELDRPPDLRDLGRKGKAYNALLKFIWGMLEEKDHPFATPEDLAAHITPDNAADAMEALAKALGGNLERDQKKSRGPSDGPSDASSSG